MLLFRKYRIMYMGVFITIRIMLKRNPSAFCFLFLLSVWSNSYFPISTHQFMLLALALQGQQEVVRRQSNNDGSQKNNLSKIINLDAKETLWSLKHRET